MKEIVNHKVYELLKSKYDKITLDYVILSNDAEYEGLETHKKAVIEAFRILNIRYATYLEYNYITEIDEEKMKALPISIEELLQLPDDDYYDNRLSKNRAFSRPDPMPYWFAFLEPPHGNLYLKKDFKEFNNLLFPNKNYCEAYRWNDDFSDYFEEGKEWWGTGLWSIYNKDSGIIVIIGASLTD